MNNSRALFFAALPEMFLTKVHLNRELNALFLKVSFQSELICQRQRLIQDSPWVMGKKFKDDLTNKRKETSWPKTFFFIFR